MISSTYAFPSMETVACKDRQVVFKELVDEFQPLLLAIARELLACDLQSKFGASDVVQLTWMEAMRDLPKVRATTKRQFFGWLTRLLKNNFKDMCKAYRHNRKRSIQKERQFDDAECLISNGKSDEMFDAAQLAQVYSAVELLSPGHRQLLRWRFEENLSYVDIGRRLDRSEDSVRVKLNRTLRRLQKQIRKDDECIQ